MRVRPPEPPSPPDPSTPRGPGRRAFAAGALAELSRLDGHLDLLREIRGATGEYGLSVDTWAPRPTFWALDRQQDGDLVIGGDGFELEPVASTADARPRDRKRVRLSSDEWNVWHLSSHQALAEVRPTGDRRVASRVIEDRYDIADADVRATNSTAGPGRVAPAPNEDTRLEDGRLGLTPPPVSWSVVALSTGRR